MRLKDDEYGVLKAVQSGAGPRDSSRHGAALLKRLQRRGFIVDGRVSPTALDAMRRYDRIAKYVEKQRGSASASSSDDVSAERQSDDD